MTQVHQQLKALEQRHDVVQTKLLATLQDVIKQRKELNSQRRITTQMWSDLEAVAQKYQASALELSMTKAELQIFMGGADGDPDKVRRTEVIKNAIAEASEQFKAEQQSVTQLVGGSQREMENQLRTARMELSTMNAKMHHEGESYFRIKVARLQCGPTPWQRAARYLPSTRL